MTRPTDVLVIGAGVIGLTTGIRLAETGLAVELWAADPPEATASFAAGALWGPHLVGDQPEVNEWAGASLPILAALADEHGTGVTLVDGLDASRGTAGPPGWVSMLDGVRMCRPDELPPGYATGWRYRAPVLDMPVYLTYLRDRLVATGATLRTRRATSLPEAATDSGARAMVNCTGLGARELVGDDRLVPIRGQVVICENPGVTEFFCEDTSGNPTDLVYYFPHGGTVLLGGLAQVGDDRRDVDPTAIDAIVGRCAAVDPRLGSARIVGHRVGLRPGRPGVRVEPASAAGVPVVHNYGHGGSGVTLAWGCAATVTDLVAAALA